MENIEEHKEFEESAYADLQEAERCIEKHTILAQVFCLSITVDNC